MSTPKNSNSGKVRIGIVGFGYWGPNLVRNFNAQEGCELVGVVDGEEKSRERVRRAYPNVGVFSSLDELLAKENPDAVVIATPPATHRDLAVKALDAGAHVLIEKPMAASVAECDEILEHASRAGRLVMIDHTFVYHPAVRYLADFTQKGELGELLYYDSVRVNLGGFQPRTNVLWDLGPHDLSILDSLTGGKTPVEVSTTAVKHFAGTVENLCYVNLRYADNFVAHLHLNWIAPIKLRTVMLGGSKKMALYDDNSPTEKIKIYDKGLSLDYRSASEHDFRVSYRVGDMTAPAIAGTEALAGMAAHFIDCVRSGKTPLTDGASGRRVVALLEAASESIRLDGAPVPVRLVRAVGKAA